MEAAYPRNRRTTLFYACLLAAWGACVVLVATRHEFWRDEVRPLSFAMESASLGDLFGFMTDDGHPMLWHLLLYLSYRLTSSTLVLPALSVLIAGAAVALFLFRSPFPPWIKVAFVFCGLPIYEYSVMARNYGISMLLLFVFAAMYPLRRRHPTAAAVVLALLCNTNIHSLLLACLLMTVWLWDAFVEGTSAPRGAIARTMPAAVGILALGVAASLYTVWPTPDMIASDATGYTATNVLRGAASTVRMPSLKFGELFPRFVPPVLASGVLVGSTLGLVGHPFALVIATAGWCALGVLFSVVYPGAYRQQGLFVAFVVCLYWIVLDSRRQPPPQTVSRKVFHAGLHAGLPLLLACLVASGARNVSRDWTYGASASRTFQAFLKDHPEYAKAVLVGEPDYYLESVPYYAGNRIYIVREQRFGGTVRFVRSAQLQLSLGQLLCAAWQLQEREQVPVLIALGHLAADGSAWESRATGQSVSYRYLRTFSWSTEELADWRRHTTLQRQFAQDVIGDEKYAVYSLATLSSGPGPACPATR